MEFAQRKQYNAILIKHNKWQIQTLEKGKKAKHTYAEKKNNIAKGKHGLLIPDANVLCGLGLQASLLG